MDAGCISTYSVRLYLYDDLSYIIFGCILISVS